MKLTVLGKHGPWPKAGSACSGYLLEGGGKRLLLDCGCGILGKLQQHCAIPELDGVVLTHLHSDHMGDMMVLRYAMPYFLGIGLTRDPLPVLLPAGPQAVAETILNDPGFAARTVQGGDRMEFLGLDLSFFAVRHPVPCNAVKVQCGGKALVYSGDLNTTPGFAGFAAGVDLLLIDGCFPTADWADDKPHLSARLAAEVGAEAGAGRVVITHFRPEDDEALLLEEARQACPWAELAREGVSYDL